MQIVSLKGASKEQKVALLKQLGYGIDPDGVHVVDGRTGERVVDRYAKVEVSLDRMMILPGSTILLDDNEFSLISYIEEQGDIF
jgi:hypothetical protein